MIRPAAIALSLTAPCLMGCGVAQSVFQAEGPASARITHLSLFMTVLFFVITVIMWALIAWAFSRRRGSLAEHAPINAGGGHLWIAIGGIAVPLLVLSVLFVLGLNLLMDFPIHGMHSGMSNMSEMSMKPEIRITGHQWWWEIQYLDDDVNRQFTTANELYLPSHRPINIEVVTADVMHSFWIPALHGKVDLVPGHKNYIRIEASNDATYSGQCAEFCGSQHAHMGLVAVTQEPGDYETWLETQRQPAAPPQTTEALLGQQTFLAGPCSMCHTVRGTIAGGRVAPDLTHIGSRLAIASGTYPNNNAYLEAWLTHAQSMKPGSQMPDLTQFTGDQLTGLVAYLRQLQ